MTARIPILLADGTIISVQANSGVKCSPPSDATFAYGAVDIMIEKEGEHAWNNGLEKHQPWTTTEELMAIIIRGGGIVGGQLPPLDFGNHELIVARVDKIQRETDDWWQVQQAEKEAEEAQQRREYGYVHPTVDDYDESLDDPNYEEPEEPGDEEE